MEISKDVKSKKDIKKEKIQPLVIKKHNALTDGFIPKTAKQVLPDKLLNALYWKYENEGTTFQMSLAEIKELLGIKYKTANIDKQIINAIRILSTAVTIKNVNIGGREAEWVSMAFIVSAVKWKDNQNYIEFTINPDMYEILKQKAGYTPIDLRIANRFRTKFGLKLYEMYKRYRNLPNKIENNVCIVEKTIEELNRMFCTKYQYPGQLFSCGKTKKPINRGLEEIKEIAGARINCFFSKERNVFVFYWEKQEEGELCRIPLRRVEEFVFWYVSMKENDINYIERYVREIKAKVLQDDFDNLDVNYQNFLKMKYGFTDEEIQNMYDPRSGRYKDFPARQPILF